MLHGTLVRMSHDGVDRRRPSGVQVVGSRTARVRGLLGRGGGRRRRRSPRRCRVAAPGRRPTRYPAAGSGRLRSSPSGLPSGRMRRRSSSSRHGRAAAYGPRLETAQRARLSSEDVALGCCSWRHSSPRRSTGLHKLRLAQLVGPRRVRVRRRMARLSAAASGSQLPTSLLPWHYLAGGSDPVGTREGQASGAAVPRDRVRLVSRDARRERDRRALDSGIAPCCTRIAGPLVQLILAYPTGQSSELARSGSRRSSLGRRLCYPSRSERCVDHRPS